MTTNPPRLHAERAGGRRTGLRFKFVAAIVLLLTVTLSAAALVASATQQRLLQESLDNKAEALGQFVALISPAAIYSFDITTLDRFMKQVSGDPDVAFALVRNRQGQAMTTYLPPGITRAEVTGRLDGPWEKGNVKLFYFPISVDKATLGDVVVAVDFSALKAMIHQHLITQISVYLGIILFLAVVIFYIFRVNVLQPVAALMRGVNQVGGGEFDHKIPVMADDELGSLAHCFNDMMAEISLDRERLLAANQELAGEIQQRREATRQLQMLSQAVEQSPVAVVIAGTDGQVEYVNPEFTRMSGYGAQEVVGQPVTGLNRLEPQPENFRSVVDTLRSTTQWRGEVPNLRKDGTPYWEFVRIAPIRQDDGTVSHHLIAQEDITQRKESERNLQLAASVFTSAREGIAITQADGTIIEVNDAFSRITGYSRADSVGQNPRILKSGRHGKEFYQAMWNELIHKGHWYGEIWNRRKNGDIYPQILTISAVRDADGKVLHYVALFTDITAQKAHQEQLEYIAHFDALTNLPNRVLLADRLNQAMAHAKRRQQFLAVAYLDLDGFKKINDAYGHEVGDQLLISIADSTKRSMRGGDTIARIGGDEFVAVLTDIDRREDCAPLLQRLLGAASNPVSVEGRLLHVSASVGVTFYPQDEKVDAEQLLRQADQAMYQSKLLGKNRFHVFDTERDRNVRGQYESLERIRRALHDNEFLLFYQPKVNMRTGTVVGLEALIRWQHPERGLLLPGTFLPVVEDHPLAVDIGNWVLDAALAQIEAWRTQGVDLPVSVNVAARHLQAPSFLEDLKLRIGRHPDLPPGHLQLEILETSALDDIAQVSHVMHACREMGISFALDDFGTGYSSLTYLRRLPAKELKIDYSFVRDMLEDPEDLAILAGVLGLAAAFRRRTVAEGVESAAHGDMLLQLGCEFAQGFSIARPVPAAAILDWIANWKPAPSWATQRAVEQENMPRLFAAVEHRAWMRNLEEVLRGEHHIVPPMDRNECRFGHWLNGSGAEMYGTSAAFAKVRELHDRVHDIGNQLMELWERGDGRRAWERLPELHRAGKELLQQLERI